MAVAKRKKMGRPPFEDPAQVRSDKLSITLTANEKQALQRAADDEDKTASTLAREAVLTHPAVVRNLEIESDYRNLRLLAHDWLNRTEEMSRYFGLYIDAPQAAELDKLIGKLRERVKLYEETLPM